MRAWDLFGIWLCGRKSRLSQSGSLILLVLRTSLQPRPTREIVGQAVLKVHDIPHGTTQGNTGTMSSQLNLAAI